MKLHQALAQFRVLGFRVSRVITTKKSSNVVERFSPTTQRESPWTYATVDAASTAPEAAAASAEARPLCWASGRSSSAGAGAAYAEAKSWKEGSVRRVRQSALLRVSTANSR